MGARKRTAASGIAKPLRVPAAQYRRR